MLSRRNIRIKVMQMLYTLSRDKELTFEDALDRYKEVINHSFELYLFNLLYLIKVTAYAQKDAAKRAQKHLPSEEDKLFTDKLYSNPLIQSLAKNEALFKLIEQYKFDELIDSDNTRSLYKDFAKSEEYKTYILQPESTEEDHRNILLKLYKSCVSSDLFNELMDDHFPTWVDDKSLVVGTIKKTIKQLPAQADFYKVHQPNDETTVDFGEVLLRQVHEKDKELLGLIEPTLKNWDVDRVAIVDMILLKMALSELITFPTIPTKVTLNEFVEISKLYSTDKSKDFINGILDRLMKKLNKEGKIKKEGRGLFE